MRIRAVGMDVDGTMTDGRVYMVSGQEALAFNRRDGMGIANLRNAGLFVFAVSGDVNENAAARCRKLGISGWFGVKDKVALVETVLAEKAIAWGELAYIGDDENDVHVLSKAGISAVPCGHYCGAGVSDIVSFCCSRQGGDGAVREFSDYLLGRGGHIQHIVSVSGVRMADKPAINEACSCGDQ